MKEIKGRFVGKGKKIAIVISRFNEFLSGQLLSGCIDSLVKSDVDEKNITVVWTPGAFEIPPVISAFNAAAFDAIITLGVVIRGETPHFDYIASESSKGVASLSMQKKIPIIYGIITADTMDQAMARAGTKQGNKGRDAAMSALEMIDIYQQL